MHFRIKGAHWIRPCSL